MTYSSPDPATPRAEQFENRRSPVINGSTPLTVLKLLAAMGVALIILGLDINAPFEADQETYYASVIRDVAENGHWLAPVDAYGEICRKPPLYVWLSALLVKATHGSVDEATTRAVSVIAGAVLAGETLLIGQACLGPAGGWLAYLFLLGSYGFASQAACAQTDMLMALLILSALALACLLEEEQVSSSTSVAVGLLLGLAILTKGPLALVLSGIVMMLYRWLEGRDPLGFLRRRWVWSATTVALIIGLSWYGVAWLNWRQDLVTVHMLQENLGHFLPARFGGTGEAAKPFYFPTAKLFAGALPMSLGAPALILALWLSWQRLVSVRLLALQLSVVVVVLVFFSLASSKRPVYVLPAYPALAILLAWVFLTDQRSPTMSLESCDLGSRSAARAADARLKAARIALEDKTQTCGKSPDRAGSLVSAACRAAWMLTGLGFIAAIVLCLIAGFTRGLSPALLAHFAPTDAGYAALFLRLTARPSVGIIIFVLVSLVGLGILVGGLWRRSSPVSSFGAALLAVAGVGLWLGVLKTAHAELYTLKSFVAKAKSLTDGAPVYVLGGEDYQVSFYYKKTVPIWRPDDLTRFAKPSIVYLIGWSDDLARAQIPTGHRAEISHCADAKRPRGRMCMAKVIPLGSTVSGLRSR
jgi:hypothetical protein